MNASKQFAQDMLKLLFQNAAITDIGDASGILGSTSAGSVYLRLCTDAATVDIETLGTEASYTGYTAGGLAVARNATKWTVTWNDTDNQGEVVNAEEEVFGERTDSGTEEVLQYLEVWKDNSSSDIEDRICWLEFDNTISITQGVQPRFQAEKLKFTFK